MARQRVVNTHFWNDDYIIDLRADEKLLFLYILTNPQTDLCGAYQIALKQMAFHTRITPRRVEVILGKFRASGKVCYHRGWILIRNFAKHQCQTNPKVSKGVERSLSACPDWVKEALEKGFDRLSPKTAPEPELLPEPEPSDVFEGGDLDAVMDGLRKRLKLNVLRDEAGWSDAAVWAFGEGFPPGAFLECFDLLSRQKWRKGRITPKNVADNLPELDKIKQELSEQDAADKKRNPAGKTETDEGRYSIGLTDVQILQ